MTSAEADENERIFVEKMQGAPPSMLQFDERERIYKPVPIPEYERGDA